MLHVGRDNAVGHLRAGREPARDDGMSMVLFRICSNDLYLISGNTDRISKGDHN